jgi:hypothetical protein
MNFAKALTLTSLVCFQLTSVRSQTWQSSIVNYGTDNKLVYVSDTAGNRIPDFSYAGYKNGNVPIPDVSVVKTIDPIVGDNTANIQNAINYVAGLALDGNGFRGALLLNAGIYRVSGKLRINASGVVLRGVGEGSDSTANTIILATGDSLTQTTVLTAGGGSDTKWSGQVSGTQTNITTDTVYVGARSFQVANASLFSVGDNIIIYHPCSSGWLQAVNYGDPATDLPWAENAWPIVYNRYIVAKVGNTITIDAPVFNTLNRSLSQSYMYKYNRSGLQTNIGIENLRIDIYTTDITTNAKGNEHDHAWDAIRFMQVEDAWAQHCTALHFGQSGFKTSTSTRITIDSCSALDPVCIITGERRYNFNVYTASQLILFKNCRATYGRHDFVSNGTSWVSGCVFLDCSSANAYASSEGHRSWSQGLLYDNITFTTTKTTIVLGLYNRGDYGTSHGWASAHSVAWNCSTNARTIIIQKPPTAQNYAIGCFGNVSGNGPFTHPQGYIEGTGQLGLNPRSLYWAQLVERLSGSTSVKEISTSLPMAFRLEQNYPNPFNPITAMSYQLSCTSFVSLKIYDLLGREVATLVNQEMQSGKHQVQWDASHNASGVYWCRLQVKNYVETKKLVLVK